MGKDRESDCSLNVIKNLEEKESTKDQDRSLNLSRCSTSHSPVVWISVCSCKSEEAFHHIGLLYFRMLECSFAAANTYSI